MYCVLICTCILASVTMFFHMRTSTFLSESSKRWFTHVFWGVVVCAAAEMAGDWLGARESCPVLHIAIRCVEFSLTPWLPIMMAYACGVRELLKPVAYLASAHMFIELLFLPWGLIICVDDQSRYTHGPLYDVYTVTYAISFFYLIVSILILSRRFRNRDRITITLALLTLLALLTALIPSLLVREIRTAFLGITFAAILLYEYYGGLVQQDVSADLAERHRQISARIISIADVYDALTMRRVYKEPLPPEQALRMIEDGTGTQFDPLLAPLFVQEMRGNLAQRNSL